MTFCIDDFLQKAKDYVTYMGTAPEKFTPALEKMAKGIQKIDPLTGKVTEQFKKAYAALKEWANVTFDKVAQRIQKLKKAVEGGFLDKKSLEEEYRKVSSQVKAQVILDLEPLKNNFSTQSQYQSVLASEYLSRLQDLGGDTTFVEMAKKEFSNAFAKSGSAIGEIIERTAGRMSGTRYTQEVRVNGVSQAQTAPISQGFNIQSFNQALSPVVSGIQQIASQNQSVKSVDYTSYISSIVAELKNTTVSVQNVKVAVDTMNTNVNSELQNIQSAVSQKNQQVQTQSSFDPSAVISEIKSVSLAVAALENALKTQPASSYDDSNVLSGIAEIRNSINALDGSLKSMSGSNSYDIDVNIEQVNAESRQQASTFGNQVGKSIANVLTGLGNGGV